MREIKFRAWHKKEKRIYPVNMIWLGEMVSLVVNEKSSNDLLAGNGYVGWDEVELMQYTGLKDKNGKEIYKGDILGWAYKLNGEEVKEYSVVMWDDTDVGFDFGDYRRPRFCQREVVGNIHANPELLEVSK